MAPKIARVFPSEVAETLAILSELHALSETLDTAMSLQLASDRIAPADYIAAWQGVGRAADRNRQIDLTLSIAAQLDRITRLPLLRNALRLMRGPARAAGFGELQRSLESGFDTFRAMKGAEEFIAFIAERERDLAAALFAAGSGGAADDASMDRRWRPCLRRRGSSTDRVRRYRQRRTSSAQRLRTCRGPGRMSARERSANGPAAASSGRPSWAAMTSVCSPRLELNSSPQLNVAR